MRKIILSLLLLLITFVPSVAQDDETAEPHPFVEMLARVPDTESVRDYIVTYIDYPGTFSALNGVGMPGSFSAFEVLRDLRGDVVITSLQRINTEPRLDYLMQYGDMPDVVGFDFFEIARAVTYGQPPDQGVIYQVDYDADAVTAAHLARDYTEETIAGVAALCGPDGCDSGLDAGLTDRNPANIFDPALGRKPPILLTEGYLSSAFILDRAQSLAEVATGDAPSLAESADYGLLADALVDIAGGLVEGDADSLLQLQIFPAALISPDYEQMGPELADEIIARMDESVLPAYEFVVFADMQAGFDTQVGVLAIVTAADTAEAAAALLAERIPAFTSTRSPEPLFDRLTTFEVEPGVYAGDDDLAVAYVIVRYPSPVRTDDSPSALISGEVYRWWIQAIMFREYYPLWNRP